MSLRARRALTVVGLVGVLLSSGGWATECQGEGGNAGSGTGAVPIGKGKLQKVTMSVTWKPVRRKKPVLIQYTVAGTDFIVDHRTTSPWNHYIDYIGSGQLFLSATNDYTADDSDIGDLDCLISIDGKTVSHSHRKDRGQIRCEYDPPAD